MIRISRPVEPDDIKSARSDKLVKDIMEERGYTLRSSGAEYGDRFQDWIGASPAAEMRDYTNSILSDILSCRIPNQWFTVEWLHVS
jgi:hypothetical protein